MTRVTTPRAWASHSQPDIRALLHDIPQATGRLLDELDAVDLGRELRRSPSCQLRAVDRTLPRQSLDELMAACEAYALISAPAALTGGDAASVQRGAAELLSMLDTLARAAEKRRGSTRRSTVRLSPLRLALAEPGVNDSLQKLIELFAAIAVGDGDHPSHRSLLPRILRTGARLLMPGSVLLVALALIVFLLDSIAVATNHVNISPNGVPVASQQDSPQPTVTSASGSNRAPTVTPRRQPTPSPVPIGTPTTTTSGAPMIAVSQLNQDPCPTARFTITYGSGHGQVTWAATPDTTANMLVSLDASTYAGSVSGTLQPGQQLTVYVKSQQDNMTGKIAVTASNGQSLYVDYSSTGC